jgi:hypothetical protein
MNPIQSAHQSFVNASDRVEYYRANPQIHNSGILRKRAEREAELALARIQFHQTGSCAHSFTETTTSGSQSFTGGDVTDTLEDHTQCLVCGEAV